MSSMLLVYHFKTATRCVQLACAHAEIRLKFVAEHQRLLETELLEAHAKLTLAEEKKKQLSAQLITCKPSLNNSS